MGHPGHTRRAGGSLGTGAGSPGVGRVGADSSVPGDEESVARAVARHPSRFVGFFMLDPTAPDATSRAERGLEQLGLRTICLFPSHAALFAARSARAGDCRDCGRARRHGSVRSLRRVVGRRSTRSSGCPAASMSGTAIRWIFMRWRPTTRTCRSSFRISARGCSAKLCSSPICAPTCTSTRRARTGGWHITRRLDLAGVFRQALQVAGPDRLLFGTDSSFFPRGWNTRSLRRAGKRAGCRGRRRKRPPAHFCRQFRAVVSGLNRR